jgi:hypothetical protein
VKILRGWSGFAKIIRYYFFPGSAQMALRLVARQICPARQ